MRKNAPNERTGDTGRTPDGDGSRHGGDGSTTKEH